MKNLTDIEIAQSVTPKPIGRLAADLDLDPDDLIPFGYHRGKVHYRAIGKSQRPGGQLILVSAITPTPSCSVGPRTSSSPCAASRSPRARASSSP
jgi:formate--tetrahydrofolate ligase